MRNWLSWLVGFLVCFSGLFLLLLVYALDEPSMWLPMLFGIAFYGLMACLPRISPQRRIGISLLFASISCFLWAASGALGFTATRLAVQHAFEVLLCVLGLAGLIVAFRRDEAGKPNIIPVVVLMLFGWLISYFSSTHGGASPMVDWVMRHLGLGRHAADLLIIGVRKTIHVTFYGVVALTALAAANRNGTIIPAVRFAVLTTLTYASFDEIRQSTQAGRTGSAWDVLLDMAGASIALLIVTSLATKKIARSPAKSGKSTKM